MLDNILRLNMLTQKPLEKVASIATTLAFLKVSVIAERDFDNNFLFKNRQNLTFFYFTPQD